MEIIFFERVGVDRRKSHRRVLKSRCRDGKFALELGNVFDEEGIVKSGKPATESGKGDTV